MSTRMLVYAGLGAALLLSAPQALAAAMADGTYRCTIGGYTMHLGDIEINGNEYRGPAFDGAYEGWHDYERSDAGTIDWGGPLGGISSGGNTVVSTVVTDAGGGTQGFDITIQNERGNFQTVSCAPE